MKKQNSKILLYFFLPLLFFSKTPKIQQKKSNSIIEVKANMPYELERLIFMEKVRTGKIILLQNNLSTDINKIKILQENKNIDFENKR